MVTTPDGVSVSAGDLNAQVTALQQILDTRARAVENAQQRAHQAVLQARAQQAANEQQARALQLRAASRGLRINSRPGVGVNVPFLGFVGSEGEFSVEPDPTNPVFKAMQLDQQLGRTRLEGEQAENRRSALQDRIQEETALISQELQDIPKTTSPAGRAHFESEILDRFDPRSVQAFRERELQKRVSEASAEATEARASQLTAQARKEETLSDLVQNPNEFLDRFLKGTSNEELADMGVETEEELTGALRSFVAELMGSNEIPTEDRFREFLKERQLRGLEIENQKAQLNRSIEGLGALDSQIAQNLASPVSTEDPTPKGRAVLEKVLQDMSNADPDDQLDISSVKDAVESYDYAALLRALNVAAPELARLSGTNSQEAIQQVMAREFLFPIASAVSNLRGLKAVEKDGVIQIEKDTREAKFDILSKQAEEGFRLFPIFGDMGRVGDFFPSDDDIAAMNTMLLSMQEEARQVFELNNGS